LGEIVTLSNVFQLQRARYLIRLPVTAKIRNRGILT
jgi:hypothetical protein